jgi:hypothetical protein
VTPIGCIRADYEGGFGRPFDFAGELGSNPGAPARFSAEKAMDERRIPDEAPDRG